MTEDRLARIALNAVPYMHPSTFHRLVSAFGSASAVFNSSIKQLVAVKDVTPGLADAVKATDPEKIAKQEVDWAEQIGASIYVFGEPGYPEPLSKVFAPPPVLSIQGQWQGENEMSVAIVGTRVPTTYGKLMTEKLTRGLVDAGITVISGLARGVDGIAHRTAIREGGRTMVVLGCGLNVKYPPEHHELQSKVVDHGAVISQFSFTTGPDKMRFPIRNRVISGLTLGTVVIEAAEKSGALITAFSALDQNREVFALPGPVNSPKSKGTNNLIKKGHAKLVESAEDIINELPEYMRDIILNRQLNLKVDHPETIINQIDSLGRDERIIAGIVDHTEKHIDNIVEQSGLPMSKVSAILLSLEIKGLIKQMAGKRFISAL